MRLTLLVLLGLFCMPMVASAQTDEIQVYDAEIEEPGVFNLMVHTNFTPIDRKEPDTAQGTGFKKIGGLRK